MIGARLAKTYGFKPSSHSYPLLPTGFNACIDHGWPSQHRMFQKSAIEVGGAGRLQEIEGGFEPHI